MRTIFLTSLPRSGSTWAAKAISKLARAKLVQEPFNWRNYPEREKFHMLYAPEGMVAKDFQQIYYNSTNHVLGPIDYLLGRKTIVVKDVHTCLAAEWIWQLYHPYTIFLLRHPCGMAESWSRLQLEVSSRIDLLLSQTTLVEQHLHSFAAHLRSRRDYFFQLGAYWGASYYVMDRLSQNHPEWQWVTHESLCVDSENQFLSLLERVEYPVDPYGRDLLHRFLIRNNRAQRTREGPHSVARLTQQEPEKWRHRLTQEQINRVFSGAEPFDLLRRFYPAEPSPS